MHAGNGEEVDGAGDDAGDLVRVEAGGDEEEDDDEEEEESARRAEAFPLHLQRDPDDDEHLDEGVDDGQDGGQQQLRGEGEEEEEEHL